MSASKKLLGNGFANALQKLVRTGEQILLVPFFIATWGAVYYGEWLTLTAIPTALALSDLGLGSAAANTFVLRYAAGDKKQAAKVIYSGYSLISIAILCMSVLGLLAVLIVYSTDWFKGGKIPRDEAFMTLGILILSRLINLYNQLSESLFRAGRKAAAAVHYFSIYSVLRIIGTLVILKISGSIIHIAICDLVLTLVFSVIYAYLGFRQIEKLPSVSISQIVPEISSLFKKGLAYLASPVWQAIFFQGTTLVVSATLGASAVALFNTLRTLCRSVNQVFSMVNGTIFPELQYEIGAGNMEGARSLYKLGIGIAVVSSVVGSLLLWFLGPFIYKIWTHGQLVPPREIWAIFLVGILLNATWWTASMVFRAANRPEGFAVVGVVGAVLSVLTSWILVKYFGLTGASIGSLVIEIIMTIYCLRATCRILHQDPARLPYDIWNYFKTSVQMFLRKATKNPL